MIRESTFSNQCFDRKERSGSLFIASESVQPGPPADSGHLLRAQKGIKGGGQRFLVVTGGDRSLQYQRNFLGLLGDHEDHRIAFLGQAQGRPVAGAVTLVDMWILRERQQAAGGMDSALVDNDAPVMHGGGGQEDSHYQLPAQTGVKPVAGVDIVAQSGVPFDDDEGADAASGHVGGGTDYLFHVCLLYTSDAADE